MRVPPVYRRDRPPVLDGDRATKNVQKVYVWYGVAQYAGNLRVDSLVGYLNTKLIKSQYFELSSRAKHIYVKALGHQDKA